MTPIQIAFVLISIINCWLVWRVSRQMYALHIQINSRMDDWMLAAKELARAVGQTEGAALERQRTRDDH